MGPVIRIRQAELVSLTTKVVQEHEDFARSTAIGHAVFIFSA